LERLHILEIRNCESFNCVAGVKHLANSLEELILNNGIFLHGHEEWVEFPFVEKLNLLNVLFDNPDEDQANRIENFALSPDAFPSLLILDMEDPSDIFCTKILESCQRESPTIKRVNNENMRRKQGLVALSMVPVEALIFKNTLSMNDTSLFTSWSEEKIITKTLKKFTLMQYADLVSSVSFLTNCKQLESLTLFQISSDIDFSVLSNLPRLKELSFRSGCPYGEKLLVIKDLFRSAGKKKAPVVVLPLMQKLELRFEVALSRFEGLENIFPNLRILESSTRVDERENDKKLLNSFLYLVRNFPKLEEIRFNGQGPSSHKIFKRFTGDTTIFKPMHTRIPRLLKQEKPGLSIYYPSLCQYEPEPEKEGTRRDREQ
jgi:hypothetical protein